MSQKYFISPDEIAPLSDGMCSILRALNTARTGKSGVCAVHASSKGYRITFNGKSIARGKNGHELHLSFEQAIRCKQA